MSVSVNYFIRGGVVLINGSATPPTATQAQQVFKQTAQVVMLDADTQAIFTHNWGLGVIAPTYFNPEIWYAGAGAPPQAGGTWRPNFSFDLSNTNAILINKLNFLGTGGTFLFIARRPHSIGE